ncbi:MAG: HlyD family efflux transporter periplasmic adaptor subunit [Bacteroidetes bacterium]|nr:HlyD family efflux transporter periplasmic adaptor subunit [Bacteroidota bacterium]
MLHISPESVEKEIPVNKLYSIRLVSTPRTGKIVTYWLLGILLLLLVILFIPWQQNVNGSGQLTALSPQERPQTVQSPIAGRIDDWFVQEGQFVKKGDTILVLTEIKEKFLDPELLPRLREQVASKEGVIQSTFDKAGALDNQISALRSSVILKLRQAENKVVQGKLKVKSDSIDLVAEQLNFAIADTQLTLGKNMFSKGLISLTEYQKRQEKFQSSTAKLISQENKLLDSKNALLNAQIELNSIRAEYQEKIAKAESDRSATLAYVAEAEGDLAKLENEYSSMLVRNTFYTIRAPQDGFVVKAVRVGLGENIKEGEPIVTIMPANPKLAVEMYVKAMDTPLLRKGQKVRVQFDGWPAIVFAGWPNVSVGTFGGIIQVVDYVESANGSFRVLIVPDPEDEPWPTQIRMGSGVYGWAMLDNVPIWFEIWRQLNGFPPNLPGDALSPATASDSKDKAPKK